MMVINEEAKGVSIHAPREGCDLAQLVIRRSGGEVSIHAPREGCDLLLKCAPYYISKFQFTHPGRGATQKRVRS